MAVYTVLTAAEIDAVAMTLGLGEPCSWQGVGAGVENSTYFLRCRGASSAIGETQAEPREFVLTIAEAAAPEEVAFVSAWMSRLARSGLPVPEPLCQPAGGHSVITVQGKPAIVVPKIAGEHQLQPEPSHCTAIGCFLGAMHRLALRSGEQHRSARSLDWVAATARRLLPQLDEGDRQLLREELSRLERLQAAGLPVGIIHGDLFRDNALFRGSELGAVIDFFMAGSGPLGFDLAVAINDWCSAEDFTLDSARVAAMLSAYESKRPLTAVERHCWPELLCLAAARFWISRLQACLEPRSARPEMVAASKDPDQQRAMLLLRRAAAVTLPNMS